MTYSLALAPFRVPSTGVRVGEPTPAPGTGAIVSTDDVREYAGYLRAALDQIEQAWRAWHDLKLWDNGGTPVNTAECQAVHQRPDATPDEKVKACLPEFYGQMSAAEAWSREDVHRLAHLPYTTWDMAHQMDGAGHLRLPWTGYYGLERAWLTSIMEGGVWLSIQTQLFGSFAGVYSQLEEDQQEMRALLASARSRGLRGVPEIGAQPPGFGEELGGAIGTGIRGVTETLGSALSPLLVLGGLIFGVSLMSRGRR